MDQPKEQEMRYHDVEALFLALGFKAFICSDECLVKLFSDPFSLTSQLFKSDKHVIIRGNPDSINANKGMFDEVAVLFMSDGNILWTVID